MPKHKVRHGPREYVIDDEAHYEHRVEKRIEWKDDPEDPALDRHTMPGAPTAAKPKNWTCRGQ